MQLKVFTSLFLLGAASAADLIECPYVGKGCPRDMECYIDARKCKIGLDCSGVCVFRNTYKSCFTDESCLEGEECIEDVRLPDACGRLCGEAAVCVPKKRQTCGGFAGWKCAKGKFCYENWRSGCVPTRGMSCVGECW